MLFLRWLLSLFVLFSICAVEAKKTIYKELQINWNTLPDRDDPPASSNEPRDIILGAVYWIKPSELVSHVFSFEQLRNLTPA